MSLLICWNVGRTTGSGDLPSGRGGGSTLNQIGRLAITRGTSIDLQQRPGAGSGAAWRT